MPFVYLLTAQDGQRFKIGLTDSLSRRVKEIDAHIPLSLDASWALETPYHHQLEKTLHFLFRNFRLPAQGTMDGKTEWFDTQALTKLQELITSQPTLFGCSAVTRGIVESKPPQGIVTKFDSKNDDQGAYLGAFLLAQRGLLKRTNELIEAADNLVKSGHLIGAVARQDDDEPSYYLLLKSNKAAGEDPDYHLEFRENGWISYTPKVCDSFPIFGTAVISGVRGAERSSDYCLALARFPNPHEDRYWDFSEKKLGLRFNYCAVAAQRKLHDWVATNIPGIKPATLDEIVRNRFEEQVARHGVGSPWRQAAPRQS